MVRVSSPAKLRPWSELTAKMVMGVVPGLVISGGRKVGHGLAVHGVGQISGPEIDFSGPEVSSKIPCSVG